MSSPAFTQQQPRSLGAPIAIALFVLAAAAFAYSLYMRHGKVEATATQTAVIETTTVYKSDSKVLTATPSTELVLFVAPTLAISNHTRIAVTVSELTLTLTDATGAQLTADPMTPAEIASAEQSFPQLRPALAGTLLRADKEVAPEATRSGTLLYSLRVRQSQWNARRSAEINIDIYHLPAVLVTLK